MAQSYPLLMMVNFMIHHHITQDTNINITNFNGGFAINDKESGKTHTDSGGQQDNHQSQ